MSTDRKSAKALKGRPGYEVGYAKPPTDTRFKPGQSGNPKGRPKGSRNKRPDMHEERMKEIVLEEAYRGIAVRDGDRTVTLPIVQAVMRSLGVNAVKGQARSQRLFVELLATVEGSRKMLHDQWLETAIEYKLGWEKELKRREKLGLTGLPEPLPHPDHVLIDLDEGTVQIVGPRTKEEKAAIDEIIAEKHILIEELRDLRVTIDACDDPKERRKLEKKWDRKMEFLGFINRLDPKNTKASAGSKKEKRK